MNKINKILLIVGFVILLAIFLLFISDFSLWEKIPPEYLGNLENVKTACELSCARLDSNDFCEEIRAVRLEGKEIFYGSCFNFSKGVLLNLDESTYLFNVSECPEISC